MAHDVFISYSSIDKKAADAACAVFEQRGIRCWIAPRDVPAGSDWAEGIIDAIDDARVMVLIFSSNSNESRQVRREVELAVGRGVTIMPLRLEAFEPTRSMAYFMAGVHWIDALTPPLETHLRKLAEWIKPHIASDGPIPEPEGPARKPPPPPKPAPAGKRALRGSGIVADLLYEFFGVGAATGGLKIRQASRAIDAAVALYTKGRHDEAIAAYLALIERIEEANAAPLDLNLAIALFNLGATYKTAGRQQEALDTYRSVVRRCGDTTDTMMHRQIAKAMNNEGTLLIDLGRPVEALDVYDELIRRFGDSPIDDLAQQVAMTRLNRGVAIGAMKRPREAIAAYDEAIAHVDLKAFPQLDVYVAQALVNKGSTLVTLGRAAEALASSEQAIALIGNARDDARREELARALVNSSGFLASLKRYEEALVACNKVIAGPRHTPTLLQMVAIAMRNRVSALRDAGRKKEAAAVAELMLSEFASSTDRVIADSYQTVRRLKASL